MRLLSRKEQDEILSKAKKIATLALKNIKSTNADLEIESNLRDIVFLTNDNLATVDFDNYTNVYRESPEYNKRLQGKDVNNESKNIDTLSECMNKSIFDYALRREFDYLDKGVK